LLIPLFEETGSLATPRYRHTATLLPDGKVLVAGGLQLSGRLLIAAGCSSMFFAGAELSHTQ
jgi:hypothetical protein